MSNERTPRRGVLLIVASPSGAGKTSLCRRLMADHKNLELSVSMTTRGIRPGEVDGRDYNFVSREEFDRLVAADAFLEWADVHGNCYGSPRAPVDRALAEGRDVLFDIDWQGARDVAEKCPGDAVRVFILPPSLAELRRRLVTRSQDSEDVIERRVANAKGEIEHCGEFDYILVNEDFDRSYADLAHVYHAERTRRERNLWVDDYKAALLREVV
ncbi:guanylate kinase [Brevundimonas sp. VNH65]|uniref:guanylate kinase n=1 Tax=Brevundimonas sp. VNH65 TaxID=3400917 RepID=UPI003C0B5102